MSKEIHYKDLSGKTGFLNGQPGLHEQEEKIANKLEKLGKEVLIIDNLFETPEKLKSVVECDNIVLSTTGMYADKLKPLLDAFEKMNYAPKVVVFMGENTAMYFVGVARELKEKHQTKFYFPDFIGDDLYEISWI